MTRVVYLAVAALAATMVLVSPAVAQDEDTMMPEQNVMVVAEETELEQAVGEPLPKSGGLAVGSVLLPAAALLLGSGVLTYALLRRR